MKKSSILGNIANVKISCTVDVYAIALTTGISFYSTTASTTPDRVIPIATLLLVNDEFESLRRRFTFYRMNAAALTFMRSYTSTNSNWINLPEIFMDLVPQVPESNFVADTVTYSDTSMRVQVINSDSRPVSKYYSLPSVSIENAGGYASLCKSWFTCGNFTSANLGGVAIGHANDPVWNGLPETNKNNEIGSIQCDFYFSFARNSKYYPAV